MAGLNSADIVKCSCGVKLSPDTSLEEALKNDYDAVVLPVSKLDLLIYKTKVLSISSQQY